MADTDEAEGSSWLKPVAIAVLVFVLLIAGVVVFIMVASPDTLPFDYAGFEGSKK